MSNPLTFLQLPELLRRPAAEWTDLLSGGLALSTSHVVPIAAAAQASGLVLVRSMGEPVSLRLSDLAALLDAELQAALAPTELGPLDLLQLGGLELTVNPAAGTFEMARIVLRYPISWDLGASWLGRPGVFVLSALTATVMLASPLSSESWGCASIAGIVQLSGGTLRLGGNLPDLELFGTLDTPLRLREVVSLFGSDVLPADVQDVALTQLAVSYWPRTREGSISARISDVWRVTLCDRTFAVDEVSLSLRWQPGFGSSMLLAGTMTLASVPLTLTAAFSPGQGWSFLASLTGGRADGSSPKVRLLPLLQELLAQDSLPPEVPDIEFSNLSLAFTPATGALSLGCTAQVDLSLAGSDIQIRAATLQIERADTGSLSVQLGLECSADIADTLQLESSWLTFDLDTASRAWSLSGGLKATLFNQQPALSLQACLRQGAGSTQISFTAEGAELGFDLVAQPPVRAVLGFRSFTLHRQQSGTQITVAVQARLSGLPQPLDRYLPAQLDLVGELANRTLTLALAATFGIDIELPPIEVAGRTLALGTMRLELSHIGLRVGRTPGLTATAGIGLPSELNKIFGTNEQGRASTDVFCTYVPPTPGAPGSAAAGLIRLALQIDTNGLSAQLLDPPLKCVTVADPLWNLDLGEFGAISLTRPTLSASGSGLSGSGALSIDAQRGLHLPLTPILSLLEMAGFGDAARALPRSVRLDRVQLIDENGEVDLAGMLGVPVNTLPVEIRAALASLGQITRRLPARLRSYLSWDIRSLSFSLSTDASGNISLEVATSTDAPLRCLLPGFPFVTGVELRRLSFGPILGGSLFKLDLDADIDVFDFATLILAQVMPDAWFGTERTQPLPPRADIQRTLHLQNLLAVIVYQAGVPIPLPLLYTQLGYSYVGIEGFGSELHLFCHSRGAATTGGRFSFDMGEALSLLTSLRRFFMESDYLLSQQSAPEGLSLVYRVKRANLTLPRYLGGKQLGITQPVEVFDLYSALAGTLDTIKTGSPRYLIGAAPLDQRVGRIEVSLLDTRSEIGWALVTRDELAATSGLVADLLAARDGHAAVGAGEVQALIPSPTAIAGSLTASSEADPDDLLCALRGSFTLGSVLGMDSLLVLRASPAGGFATGMRLRGQIASLIKLELRGVLKIALKGDQPLLLAGISQLKIADRTVMYGGFAIANNLFQIDGLIDLFPPGSPVVLRGRLSGGISKDRFWLSGQGELALMSIPLVGAQLELVFDQSQYLVKVGTTLLGASASFLLQAQQGRLVATGTMSPIRIGNLLRIARSRGNTSEGPLLLLEHTDSPGATRLELSGYASLLDLADLETTVVISPTGTRFSVDSTSLGGAIRTTFDCVLPAAGGLQVSASFTLSVSGQPTVERILPDGTIQYEQGPPLGQSVRASMRFLAIPPSSSESMIAPWRAMEAQQQVLFSASGPLRRAGAAATRLAALEDSLWTVHELHLALTAERTDDRLPIARLDRYIAATQAAVSAADALGIELTNLDRDRPAERPIWHELTSCLGAVRAAAQRGLAVATMQQQREAQLQGALDALVAALLANSGPGAAAGFLSAAQQLRDLMAARDLYPEDPGSGGAGCAAFADEETAECLAELDQVLDATRLSAQVYTASFAQSEPLLQQACAAARVRIPASDSVNNRLPGLDAAADAYGHALAQVQASYGTVEQARALAARPSARAASAIAALAARDGALQAGAEDLSWVLSVVDCFPAAPQIGEALRRLSDAQIALSRDLLLQRHDAAQQDTFLQAQTQLANLLPGFFSAPVLDPLIRASMSQGEYEAGRESGRTDLPEMSATIQARISEATQAFLAERDSHPDRARAGARLLIRDYVLRRVELKRVTALHELRQVAGLDRQLLCEHLARRPLEAGALPFLGLMLPVDAASSCATPAPLAAPDQELAISLALQLGFTDGGTTHNLADVHLEGPTAGRLSEVPGLIAVEVAARLLGISNENVWLDRRLRRHIRARLLRRQRIVEHDWAMQRYHGVA